MKTCLLLLLMFCTAKSFAQSLGDYKRKLWETPKSKNLQQYKIPKNVPLLKKEINDGDRDQMPILQPKLTMKKIGNNGKGATVYSMMPYNMPGIMPDSTFHSNMPIKSSQIVQVPVNK